MADTNNKLGFLHVALMGAFLVIILVASFIYFLGPREKVLDEGPEVTETDARAAPPEEALGRGPLRGLIVRDYHYRRAEGVIEGTLSNSTDIAFSDVQVQFDLLDEQEGVVRTITLSEELIEPGARIAFRVPVPSDVQFASVAATDIDAEIVDVEQSPETTSPSDVHAEEMTTEHGKTRP